VLHPYGGFADSAQPALRADIRLLVGSGRLHPARRRTELALVTVLGSRIPGTATWAFDESTFAWNLWYFKHALLDLGRSPLHTELIWYPLGMD